MSKRLSRNAPCPCGSGKKYKHCCIHKDFDWVEMDDGDIYRSVQLPDDVMQGFEELRTAYVAQHGREPERIFEGAPPFEIVEHWTVEAMKKAGVDPALIYAFEKTGLLLNDQNEDKLPDVEIAEWEAAIHEYEKKTGKKAVRLRLTQNDFQKIMQNGPRQSPPELHVERLPFRPTFTKETWGQWHLQDILDNPECSDYFQRCQQEVIRSGRGNAYLNMFTIMAYCDSTSRNELGREYLLQVATNRQYSVKELDKALQSIALSFGPKGIMPNPAAAFEFLDFVGTFVCEYAEHMGFKDRLNDSLVQIQGMALMAFVAAVNFEFGICDNFWAK